MSRILAVLAVAVLASTPALAQSDDAAYCAALSALASKYLVGATSEGEGFPSLDTATAIDQCRKGDTAAGIPILEKKLRASGFTLPKRS